MKGRFLITGGQGFLGSYITKSIIRNCPGSSVTLFDIGGSDKILQQVLQPKEISGLNRVYGDISKQNDVWNAFKEVKPTHVLHLAAMQIPGCRADPVRGSMVNVTGTINVFEAARNLELQGEGKVNNIVVASSAAVTGFPQDYSGPIEDETPHTPRTHYGVFKLANEGNARVYWQDHHIPSVSLRPHTIYGVGREIGVTSGPSKAIKATILGRKFQIPFSGKTSFLFVEDCADIFLKCAEANPNGALALNIRGTVMSAEEFLSILYEVLPESKNFITIKPGSPPLPLAYDFNENGLQKLLGGIVYTDIKEGIRKIANTFEELRKLGLLHDKDLEG